jgi:hypothetical protein
MPFWRDLMGTQRLPFWPSTVTGIGGIDMAVPFWQGLRMITYSTTGDAIYAIRWEVGEWQPGLRWPLLAQIQRQPQVVPCGVYENPTACSRRTTHLRRAEIDRRDSARTLQFWVSVSGRCRPSGQHILGGT